MISYDLFYKSFVDWYNEHKINATLEEAKIRFDEIIVNGITICYDDVFEDDEVVITNVMRCTYITSSESISGHTHIFEWLEVKMGIKDDNGNIIRCKTIGYSI